MNEEKSKGVIDEVLRVVPVNLRNILARAVYGYAEDIQEIVLRSGRPVCVYIKGEEMYLTQNGYLTYIKDSQPLVFASHNDITDCFNVSCGYSVYSRLNEIKEGFITISGGHRVGICGTAVVSGGSIVNVRDISTISLRFAREVTGCGEDIMSLLRKEKKGVLICGSPCSGKTTVLRDVSRLLSVDEHRRVSVVDSRGEISATVCGVTQMDLGLCDVMNGYPRAGGIEQATRVLSPHYIICDELGNYDDVAAIMSGINSGVGFVCTIHANNKEELLSSKIACELLQTGAFSRVVFLKGREFPGQIACSYETGEMFND